MATVAELMSTTLVTVAPATTIAEAATVMGGHHVGSSLVMEGGALVGIFTERDILRALSQDFDAPGHAVSHWMTRNPKSVEPDVEAEDALERMLAGGFRHFPVVEGDRVLGVVSMRDLSRAASERERGT
jgi:CBS domain-containing protein